MVCRFLLNCNHRLVEKEMGGLHLSVQRLHVEYAVEDYWEGVKW